MKNRISPLRVLTASKDKAGSHEAGGVPDSSGLASVGTLGSAGEAGGGPNGNRLGKISH